ncbi:MAG: ribbon-helix-helix protein, CopG family [Acidobacteriota bacterium]
MIRTQVSLDPDMYEEAKKEAVRQGISFAELVRRALGLTLAHRRGERPWMRFAGAIEVADPDASRSVDEVVYGRERP